jgi:uncharacterized protein (DUF1501 family)
MSRRAVLFGAAAVPLLWSMPSWAAPEASNKNVLVTIFLRGGADGLNLVAPVGDPFYERERPGLALTKAGKGEAKIIDLDGHFALNPRLAAILPAYRAGELAIVHAVGSPHPTRSHFEAQDNMETATPGRSVRDGWLARCLEQIPENERGALGAVALSERVPLALRGRVSATASKTLGGFALRAPKSLRDRLEHGFNALYSKDTDPVRRSGREALQNTKLLAAIAKDINPENGAEYTQAAKPLSEIAALIKRDVGMRAAWIDVGGWDTHQGEGTGEKGRLANLADGLGRGLAAMRQDLGERMSRVVVLVMTEFGRTVKENGTGGTDHGHASVMFAMGGPVVGGKVHGRWPTLDPDKRYERRDLAVTTDFRDVLAEIAEKHLGATDIGRLLPGYTPGPRLGLLRA